MPDQSWNFVVDQVLALDKNDPYFIKKNEAARQQLVRINRKRYDAFIDEIVKEK